MSAELKGSSIFGRKSLVPWSQWNLWLAENSGWRLWTMAIVAWAWLFFGGSAHQGMHQMHAHGMETTWWAGLWTSVQSNFTPWLVMIIAMMFPLLNEQVEHVVYSVPKRKKELAIYSYLGGYTVIWLLAGVLFVLLQNSVSLLQTQLLGLSTLWIIAGVFLITAILNALPSWGVIKMTCAYTRPISIQGKETYSDSSKFGIYAGLRCIRTCWLPMLAMVLASHDLILMLAITAILVIERYFIRHTSRFPAYAWAGLSLLFVFLALF